MAEINCQVLSLKVRPSAQLISAHHWLTKIRAKAQLSDGEGLAGKPC